MCKEVCKTDSAVGVDLKQPGDELLHRIRGRRWECELGGVRLGEHLLERLYAFGAVGRVLGDTLVEDGADAPEVGPGVV